MIQRYRGGVVPAARTAGAGPLEDAARESGAAYRHAMDHNRLEGGAAQWLGLAARANRFIQETLPWDLAKAGRDSELDFVLASLGRTAARLAILARPFIPAPAGVIWSLFEGLPSLDETRLDDLATLDVSGVRVKPSPILFPKPQAVRA